MCLSDNYYGGERLWKKLDKQPGCIAVVNCWKYLIFTVRYCLDHGDFYCNLGGKKEKKRNRTNLQSFLKWGGKGAGGSPFSLTIHWLACGTALHGFTFSVAVSTDPIKKKTIPCQFALKNENTGFLCFSDGFSHRNTCLKGDKTCNSLLAREFLLVFRNLRWSLNTPYQIHCRGPSPEIADGMNAFIGGPR